MADVIDIDAEETPITRGMRRRRARTGNSQKPVSRVFWIVLGSVIAVVSVRAFDRYFPKQPQALPPAPPEI